ncbi:O-antigen ligase [Brevundimonas sp. Root1423]|uniref:O-antigen ligase family protein n=1 Tax=Brevundimonas sp. Root1423 TaxID=1736462 RepID=UPI0006FDBE12|nr:O-antigen ligase family protein [Brevundimonas sp. Root1423]KQY84858.1 hypothetical protein ASD25_07545 [Brevundimonas sp. Root1423]
MALLVFSYLLGGASRQNEVRLALLELAALPLLVLALFALSRRSDLAGHRLALALMAGVAILPLAQLVPLPPQIWRGLPGREQLDLALSTVGIPGGWAPLSLTPDRTWRSWLALLPPMAIFAALLVCPASFRLRLPFVIIGGTVLAIVLGAAQLVSGGDGLYPWRTTDPGNVVGFFANRNHLATFCLMSLPMAAILGARVVKRRGSPQKSLLPWISILFVALVVVALGAIRSRAGIALVGPVLGACLVAAWVAAGRGRPGPVLLGMLGAASLGALAIAVFALGPLLVRFDTPGAREGRFENWPIVAEAAQGYLPVGSGIGSFDAVYRSVEPLEQLDATFFNQAHNDYLELALEAGLPAVALFIIFGIWFVRRSWTAWGGRASAERDLQRAATICIAVVLVHSAFDYPLRTTFIACLFALCCGILELASRPESDLSEPGQGRHRSRA